MKLPDAVEAEIRAIEADYDQRPGQHAGPARLRGLRSAIEADLAALREQRCETCRHSFRQEGLPDAYCGRTTFRISRPEDLSVVSWLLTATCDDLGNGCRAWARREP